MSRRERQKRRRRNRGSPVRRVFAMTIVLTVCALAVGGLALAGWVVNVAQSAPSIQSLKVTQPGQPTQVFASDGSSLGYIWSPVLHSALAGDQIPALVKRATIAIEDRRFYQHGALDYQGLLRAAVKDALSGGDSLQGGSTLTMQLVDNLYLPPQIGATHNLKYKIIQAKLAEELANLHTKNWILNSYLNDVPYGTVDNQTAYGVQSASEMFFDRPVSQLNLTQAALLAGLPQAPSEYNPFLHPAAARHRRNEVLQAMVTAGDITQGQADATGSHHLEVKQGTAFAAQHSYVFDYIQQSLDKAVCPQTPNNCVKVSEGGLKVYTTIDLKKQAEARAAILAHEGGPGQPAAGLASIQPSTGHILAIASSSDYGQTSFDYATQAHRQPGSSFKVFALMTLIHDFHGDPNSTYYTSKFLPAGWLPEDPTWSVHTAEESYQGNINLTKATIVSDNTVYVQLAADLGWDKIDQTAHAMGITSPLDGNPAEVIGGLRVGVTPLEMADAYATLANAGSHVPTTIIDKIVYPDGSVRDLGDPPHTTVFTDGEAYEATSVLKQVITSGTGTAAGYGCPAAGKTGTANNLENAWFVGYTPRMSTAVWVGYPQGNIPMANGFGGTLAAPIWHDYMKQASGSYCGDFSAPTDPFEGTPFIGKFATTGAPNVGTQNGPNGPNGTGGVGTGTATTTTTTTTTTSPYNNPTLYAKPPSTLPPAANGPGAATTTPRSGKAPQSGSGGAPVKKH
jgi:penicillin-binding protein 1A